MKQLNNVYAEVYKSGFLQLSETTKQLYAEVDESGFVFSGSLSASGKIYIRLKSASLIKLLESSMIFSVSVLNALSLRVKLGQSVLILFSSEP